MCLQKLHSEEKEGRQKTGAISATLDCSDPDECEIEQWSSAAAIEERTDSAIETISRVNK